jgi:hypothetical protein
MGRAKSKSSTLRHGETETRREDTPILSAAPPIEDSPAEAPRTWTMEELLAEQYPQGAPARVAGGMAMALQRELRRRNRKAEKGY